VKLQWYRHCTAVIQTLYFSDIDTVLQWYRHCTAVIQTLYCSDSDTVLQWNRHCTAVIQTLRCSLHCAHCYMKQSVTSFVYTINISCMNNNTAISNQYCISLFETGNKFLVKIIVCYSNKLHSVHCLHQQYTVCYWCWHC